MSDFYATAGWSGAVDLWELATGHHIANVEQPFADDVAWNPRENLLAIAAGQQVKVIDEAGEVRENLPAEAGTYFSALDFDPTGKYLVTAQGWTDRPDFAKGKGSGVGLGAARDRALDHHVVGRRRILPGRLDHRQPGFAGRPGRALRRGNRETGAHAQRTHRTRERCRLQSGRNDDRDKQQRHDGATVGDAKDGRELLALRGHEGATQSVSFSPDGTKLSSVGADGVVRVWALEQDDLVEIAHRQVTRTLTDDECLQYLHVDSCSAA